MGHIRENLEGKKVRVGGIDYTILFNDTLMAKDEKFGEVDYMGATITLDSNMNDEVAMAFLWHEVFEIIDHQSELNLKHHKIQTLGFSTHQILNDNRGIFNYNRG
jgi:hypothetical protein